MIARSRGDIANGKTNMRFTGVLYRFCGNQARSSSVVFFANSDFDIVNPTVALNLFGKSLMSVTVGEEKELRCTAANQLVSRAAGKREKAIVDIDNTPVALADDDDRVAIGIE
ncbi:hypothetical protein SDC9_127943 [bioreactor metagenome]|uniref:Uncharacterized protein n=1 Tax=bioreactor metagenome TaxID=1076179 RepID=A0A645CW20_9ZZZZ